MKPIRQTKLNAKPGAARGGGAARGKAAGAAGRAGGKAAVGASSSSAEPRNVQVRVLEDGFDLTPLPLLLSQTRAETPAEATAKDDEGSGSESDAAAWPGDRGCRGTTTSVAAERAA